MKSFRPRQLGELLKRELSVVLDQDRTVRNNQICTVTEVRVSRDGRYADVWISVLGEKDVQKKTIEKIALSGRTIRSNVADRVYLRRMPELNFKLDTTLEKAQRIEQILAEAKSKKKT